MSTQHLRNISKSKFESFLDLVDCKIIRQPGGHVVYSRCDCFRPVVIQNHIDPIPEFIVKNNLRILGYSKKDFFDILEGKIIIERKLNKYIKINSADQTK